MIAVDTNVLVRLLVKDDEAQTRKVVRLFRRLDADRERAYCLLYTSPSPRDA